MTPTNGNGKLSLKGRWAIYYADKLKMPVFPLGDRNKFPRKGSHGHLDATTDLAVIEAWWRKWPNANIGAWCRDHVLWDEDPRNGSEETIEQLVAKHGALPDTLQQITPSGGRQRFYRPPETLEITGGWDIAPGVDIKGTHGYGLLPPSQRPEGKYVWDGIARPDEQEIAPLAPWQLEMILERQRQSSGGKDESAAASNGESSPGDDTRELVEMFAASMPPEGGRHLVLIAIAGVCARKDCPQDEALSLLSALYKRFWGDKAMLYDAKKDVESTYRRFAIDGKVTGFRTLQRYFPKATLNALGDWAQLRFDQQAIDNAAEAIPEDHLATINTDPMFTDRGIEFTYGSRRKRGVLHFPALFEGELYTIKCPVAQFRKLDKFCDAVAGSLHVNLVPNEHSKANWPHLTHAFLRLTRGERLSAEEESLRLQVQDLAATAFRLNYESSVEGDDNLCKVWHTCQNYVPVDFVPSIKEGQPPIEPEFPQCVYRYGNELHVIAPCLSKVQRLRKIQGRLTIDEIHQGLEASQFESRRLTRRIDGKPRQCYVYVGPITALVPFWEPEGYEPSESDDAPVYEIK